MTRSSVGDERRARGSERARLLDADDVEIASGREGGDGGDDGTTRAFRGRVAIVGALGALALVSLGVSAASASGGVSSVTSALGDAYRAPWEREAWLGGTGNATASALERLSFGVRSSHELRWTPRECHKAPMSTSHYSKCVGSQQVRRESSEVSRTSSQDRLT